MSNFWEKYGMFICVVAFIICGMICSIDAIIFGYLFYKIIGSISIVSLIGMVVTAIKNRNNDEEDE